jgi:hypothetical protein
MHPPLSSLGAALLLLLVMPRALPGLKVRVAGF